MRLPLLALAILSLIALPQTAGQAAMQQGKKAPVEDVWKPAATPKGGVSWAVLEATKEQTRTGKDGLSLFQAPVHSGGQGAGRQEDQGRRLDEAA